MSNSIYPCLWFDGKAKEAASFYCTVFNNSKITVDSTMVVKFEIEGQMIMGLNGGPKYKINPSISFLVNCQSNEETETVWNKLIEGGSDMMPLDKYPWSEKYGWLTDKFGMTWQIMTSALPDVKVKIIPTFLFVGEQCSNAQDAMKLYTSVFPQSSIHGLQLYKAGEAQPEGNLMFGHFSLTNKIFAAMDGTGDHSFNFNEAVSFVMECETQEEIDHYWNNLISDGGQESMCGWLKDKFGVSWQIVPKVLGNLMMYPERSSRVMAELFQMKKLDIEKLMNA